MIIDSYDYGSVSGRSSGACCLGACCDGADESGSDLVGADSE